MTENLNEKIIFRTFNLLANTCPWRVHYRVLRIELLFGFGLPTFDRFITNYNICNKSFFEVKLEQSFGCTNRAFGQVFVDMKGGVMVILTQFIIIET